MTINPEELRTLGNVDLLRLPKTAFFCSRQYPPGVEHSAYLWALEQRCRGQCVVSAFHSRMEQSMFRYLLQGPQQSLVYVLGRGIQRSLSFEYGAEIRAGRLLFLTPFEPAVTTVTQDTADIRNLLIADLADQFFVPFMTPNGNISRILATPVAQGKPIVTLDLPENEELLRRGAGTWQPADILGRRLAGAQARQS